jgi:hypothetical protein
MCDTLLKKKPTFEKPKLVWIEGEKGRCITAVARASKKLFEASSSGDKSTFFAEVARLAEAIGNSLKEGQETAFVVVDLLLTKESNYRMHSNRTAIENEFNLALLGKRWTDIDDVLNRHWW